MRRRIRVGGSATAGDRHLRRRRSATTTPGLVRPVDVPEDAEGRIAYISVAAPPDAPSPDPTGEESLMPPPAATVSSWGPVVLLAAGLVVAMVLGLWLIHR